MKIKWLIVLLLSIIGVIAKDKCDNCFSHIVKKGESISLICIDYYGNYTNGMGKAIVALNPSINDINAVIVGQTLILQKPTKPTQAENVASSPVLFEKRLKITQGVVTFVVGSVKLQRKNEKLFKQLSVNTVVSHGDIIKTDEDGRAELIINREAVCRLKENTILILTEFRNSQNIDGKTNLKVIKGSIWTKMRRFTDKICRFQLSLPTAIAGVHGTVYQTNVLLDSTAEVKVYTGEVSVEGLKSTNSASSSLHEVSGPQEIAGPQEVSLDQWVQIVRSMQKISINKNGVPATVKTFKRNSDDSWEKWNEERDQRIATMFSEK